MRWWAQERGGLRCLNANDTGTGKTPESIAALHYLSLQSDYCLIVVPKSMIDKWCDKLIEWIGVRAAPLAGDFDQRQTILQNAVGRRVVLVCSYGTILRHANHLIKHPPEFLICDEAHRLKNREAQVTKIVHKMAHTRRIKHTLLLTATPTDKSPAEYWSLLHILYPDVYTSYWKFADKFCAWISNGFSRKVFAGPKNQGQLQDLLRQVMIRRTKRSVLPHLPPVTREIVSLELSSAQSTEQERMYREIKERWLTTTSQGEVLSVTSKMAEMTRLRQLCISPAILGGEDISPKLDYVMDVVAGASLPVCVYTDYQTAVNLLVARAEAAGISYVTITGKVTRRDRTAAYTAVNNREVQLCIYTQAGGEGIDLVGSDHLIMLNLPWASSIFKQVVDRLDRDGQENPVLVEFLLMRGTIDEYVYALLQQKKQWTESTMIEQVYHSIVAPDSCTYTTEEAA